MQISKEKCNTLIQNFDFKTLFNEMGWDNYNEKQPKIKIKDEIYKIDPISEKKGFVLLQCNPDNAGKIPAYNIRKKIETRVAKHHQEHLIIFCDAKNKEQIWQLTIREQNKPTITRETKYYSHQTPELIYQKLSGLFFSWDDEENITIVDVKKRVKENFNKNSEKVTKKFYQEFKKHHKAFIDFIEGVTQQIDKDWYASLMLNRLMFIYFIQKKGFLDNDKNYLSNKLKQTKEIRGDDEFYSFYRDFLIILFHNGLGAKERNVKLVKEIGKIPYLNGGLFDKHEIELRYSDIKIKDDAFEQLFTFFDQYEWHLDTRQSATGKEINPDVIGYIFEKYINDRAAMGAYYTKEDITEYISKNTIIPFLFGEVKRHYPKAFKPDEYIWQMLSLSSDKYIYDAVKYGVPQSEDVFSDFPEEIKQGFQPDIERKIVTDTDETHLWKIRKVWNKKAPEEIALPTEIYREVIERRNRYKEIKEKIVNGKITQINDFITSNLNIRQFIQDIIAETDDPFLIKHFYNAIKKVTVLDPTCGSGAFLFAALNILEPLYEGCIERMRHFTEENLNKFKTFTDILAEIESPQHPNLQYFIYKSIILNNLYGVDIMNEAVEIAKLRLFLKLVSTADVDYKKDNFGLEPLPDIDFNIRCGNTLVGFTKLDEINEYLKEKGKESFVFDDEHEKINAITDKADIVAKLFADFRQQQSICDAGSEKYRQTKIAVTKRLNELNEELNHYLAYLYGIDVELKPKKYEVWRTSHQPFHWFSEFYEIMQNGGFDVIIGNPPYVEYSKVKKIYKLTEYETIKCGNLYAYVIELATNISNSISFISFIVPISLPSTPRMENLRLSIQNKSCFIYCSNFADRPGTIFNGVHQKLSILIAKKSKKSNLQSIHTSSFYHWYSKDTMNERINLQFMISYSESPLIFNEKNFWLKIGNENVICMFDKMLRDKKNIYNYSTKFNHKNSIYLSMRLMFWTKCFLNSKQSKEYKQIYLLEKDHSTVYTSILNSSFFFMFWEMYSDCWHLTKRELMDFKFDPNKIDLNSKVLTKLSLELEKDLEKKKKFIGSVQTDYEYYHKKSKSIIDEIDTVLAQHYGFTEEELDFIINYDIRYRMGKELEAYVEGELGETDE